MIKTQYGIHGRAPYKGGAGAPAPPDACVARCAATSCATASCPAASCSDKACCCANLDRCCCAWAGNIKPTPATISMRGCAAGAAAARAGTGGRGSCCGPKQLGLQHDASDPGHRTLRPVELGGRPRRPPGRAELPPPLHLRKVCLRWQVHVCPHGPRALLGRLAWLQNQGGNRLLRGLAGARSAGHRRLVLHIAVTLRAPPLPGPPARAPPLPPRLQPEPGVAEVVDHPHQGWHHGRCGCACAGGAGRCLRQALPDGYAGAPEFEGND
jgi:hypothetical protein